MQGWIGETKKQERIMSKGNGQWITQIQNPYNFYAKNG